MPKLIIAVFKVQAQEESPEEEEESHQYKDYSYPYVVLPVDHLGLMSYADMQWSFDLMAGSNTEYLIVSGGAGDTKLKIYSLNRLELEVLDPLFYTEAS